MPHANATCNIQHSNVQLCKSYCQLLCISYGRQQLAKGLTSSMRVPIGIVWQRVLCRIGPPIGAYFIGFPAAGARRVACMRNLFFNLQLRLSKHAWRDFGQKYNYIIYIFLAQKYSNKIFGSILVSGVACPTHNFRYRQNLQNVYHHGGNSTRHSSCCIAINLTHGDTALGSWFLFEIHRFHYDSQPPATPTPPHESRLTTAINAMNAIECVRALCSQSSQPKLTICNNSLGSRAKAKEMYAIYLAVSLS